MHIFQETLHIAEDHGVSCFRIIYFEEDIVFEIITNNLYNFETIRWYSSFDILIYNKLQMLIYNICATVFNLVNVYN
jgi:hypothetical protein